MIFGISFSLSDVTAYSDFSKDKYKFIGKGRVQFFLDGLKNIMSNITLKPVNLNSITLTSLKINANINISPECVEGRDYSFINLQNQPKG